MSEKPDPSTNPLTTTNPQSIEEYLSRDPLSLSEQDVAQTTELLVKALRAERIIWAEEANKAKLTGKRISGGTTKKLQKAAALEAIKTGKAKIDLGAIMMPSAKPGGRK